MNAWSVVGALVAMVSTGCADTAANQHLRNTRLTVVLPTETQTTEAAPTQTAGGKGRWEEGQPLRLDHPAPASVATPRVARATSPMPRARPQRR